MKFAELSKEAQELVNTDFPEEIEKEAAEQVATLNELYDMGFNKMAASVADEMDKEKEEEEKEEKEKPENKLEEGQKKEASARGSFLARYFIDGLIKEGAERHGDELHYLYPALEVEFNKIAAKGGKVPGGIWEAIKKYHKGAVKEVKEGWKGKTDGKTKVQSKDWKAIAKGTGKLVGPYAGVAAAGAAGRHAYKKSKEQE